MCIRRQFCSCVNYGGSLSAVSKPRVSDIFTASCIETQHVVISVVSCFSSYRFSKWLEAISVVFHSSHLLWYVPFEGELETLVDSHIVSRHRLAYIYPPLLQGHKANLNPTVS